MAQEITVGGGGQYAPELFNTIEEIPIGSSGTILSISGTDGRRVRLETLSLTGNGNETGITIIKDGVALVSGKSIDSLPVNANEFSISQTGRNSFAETNVATSAFQSVISDVVGYSISVIKDTGSTTNTLKYSFSEGL